MIIEALLNAMLSVFSFLTSGINIPSMPAEVSQYMQEALEYVSMGVGILGNYTHIGYLLILLGVIVAVDAGVLIYKLVMWVLRKIPMLGIE